MTRVLLTLALVTSVALPQDPAIQTKVKQMTARVAPARLEETVRALVACKTRQIASQSKAQALDWLQAQLEECVTRSNGRLTIRRESHEVLATRIEQKVTCTNLIATFGETCFATVLAYFLSNAVRWSCSLKARVIRSFACLAFSVSTLAT